MPDQTTTQDRTAEVVMALYAAFERGDMPAGLACMAEDIEWHEADGLPWGGVKTGPAAVAQGVFAPAGELVPDIAVTPERTITAGDTVIVMHRYTGTAKATGTRLDLPGVGVEAELREVTPNRRLTWHGNIGADWLFAGDREFAIHPIAHDKVRFTHVEDASTDCSSHCSGY